MLSVILIWGTLFTVTSAANILSSPGRSCVHDGEKFYSGQQFVLNDCQYTCECQVDDGYPYFICEPLCKTYYDVICANGEEPIWVNEDTAYPECKCPRYICPKKLSLENLVEFGVDDGYFEPQVDTESRYVD